VERELMRKRKPRDYPSEFKLAAVERLEKGESAGEVARAVGVPRSQPRRRKKPTNADK
jgi:transposase-like protein